jgi:hypothetical protein
MSPGWAASAGLVGCTGLLIAASVLYFHKWVLPRAPIGFFRAFDIAIMSAIVVIAPLIYLWLPPAVVVTIFALVLLAAIQLVLAPIIGGRIALAVSIVLCGTTAAAWLLGHPLLTTVLTDLVLSLGVVGVTNLWVQGGLRARHVAWLAGLIAVYDLIATTLTSVTTRLATELQGMPFAPVFALTGGRAPVSIGLGDLLLLVLFPLAAARAFGRAAALVAGISAAAIVALAEALIRAGLFTTALPLVTILGPAIIIQYAFWRQLGRRERTTREWRDGVTPAVRGPDPLLALEAALEVPMPEQLPEGIWVAISDDGVVGQGVSPGLARRSARENGHLAMPLVRQT